MKYPWKAKLSLGEAFVSNAILSLNSCRKRACQSSELFRRETGLSTALRTRWVIHEGSLEDEPEAVISPFGASRGSRFLARSDRSCRGLAVPIVQLGPLSRGLSLRILTVSGYLEKYILVLALKVSLYDPASKGGTQSVP